VLLAAGCKMPTLKSTDVMYGPSGEVIQMKSPKKTMKIKVKQDEITIKGARGIGGEPRVRMPAVPVETERDVGVHGMMVPPPQGPIGPVAPAQGVPAVGVPVQQGTTTEETTVVH
jgi:hypothetical protein